MSISYLEGLLRDVFAAQGAVDAEGLARRAVMDFEHAQRDAKIYELRAEYTEKDVATRFGLSAVRVREIVREQLGRRRLNK